MNASRAVSQMTNRFYKTIMDVVKTLTKSLGQTPVQIVLGLIIVFYTAFLESDKESLISILMDNAMGRVIVLGFLSLLAISAPPVAILFAVLVVMSYSRSETIAVSTSEQEHAQHTSHEHNENFWSSPEVKQEEQQKPKNDQLMEQLSSAMKTMGMGSASLKKEGFISDGGADEDDIEQYMGNETSIMTSLDGLLGHSKEVEHSSA